jgi:hypothetical protein
VRLKPISVGKAWSTDMIPGISGECVHTFPPIFGADCVGKRVSERWIIGDSQYIIFRMQNQSFYS